jgi:methyl-accepting chemotaxis protein
VITSLLALIMSVIIGIAITRSIAFPLKLASQFVERIAKGDLTSTIELEQKDEVGDMISSLRSMVVKLKEVLEGVISSANNITGASEQLNQSAQQMSEGATMQASSVEEISSSMEEMTANIQQNTTNSKQTEKIANESAHEIEEGQKAVVDTIDSMKLIAGKISIIGEISRQTNLLALNAAVEAARAGEHGKGFAVVAAEVRKLAERSQLAATEIDGVSLKSVQISEKSGELLKSVVPNIQRTAELVKEIATSSVEQNTGTEQINGAIQQLNQVVQESAAVAEEMAASAEELDAQAITLKDLVAFFKTEGVAEKRSFAVKSKRTIINEPKKDSQVNSAAQIKQAIQKNKTLVLDQDFERF